MVDLEKINEALEKENLELTKQHIDKTSESYDGYILKNKTVDNQVAVVIREETLNSFDTKEDVLAFIHSALIDDNTQKDFLNSTSWLNDGDKICERVRPQIFPAKDIDKFNKCDVYTETIGDFGLSFFVIVDKIKDSIATVNLNNQLIDATGIDRSSLREIAFSNLKKIVIILDAKKSLEEHDLLEDETNDLIMYAVTTQDSFRGAPAIFLDEVAAEVRELIGDDFIIIPSSTDEVLCVPKPQDTPVDYLNKMLQDGNKALCKDGEILSDTVYQYKDGAICRLA